MRNAFDDLRGIDGVLKFQHGPDLGRRPGNADYFAVASFQDWDAFARYLDHPKHQYLAEVATAEITEARWSVQAEI